MKINIPIIKNASQAKRWHFWVKEDFFNPRTYPNWVVELLVKEHLKHFEGYNLFYFMTANGYDREKMAILLKNMYTYDRRKVDNLLKNSKTDEFYNKKYFDLIERDIVYPDNCVNEEKW
jgi:hypothetical protein